MSAAQARPGRRRARSWRRQARIVLGALVVAAAVWWWLRPQAGPTAAERVSACERSHEVRQEELTEDPEQVLRRCTWPAPGDEEDGYHELAVTVTTHEVDGQRDRLAYTIASPCTRLAYELAGGPGPIPVDAGQVVDGADGGPVDLTPELLEVVPELSPGTLVVLTNKGRRLVDVACI